MGESKYEHKTVRSHHGCYFSVKRSAQVTRELKDKNQSINHNDEESLRKASQRTTESQYFRRISRGHSVGSEISGVGRKLFIESRQQLETIFVTAVSIG